MDPRTLQAKYYEETASSYHEAHIAEGDIHSGALGILCGLIPELKATSMLDLGSGTGRAVEFVKGQLGSTGFPVVGVEPVRALREIGHSRGLTHDELVDGDATALPYADGSFDVVTAFALMHHVPDSRSVVAEMLRVARKAVFISDANNLGQGGPAIRMAKQTLWAAGLWPAANWIRTGGKGYHLSEGDGLSYSYTVFQDLKQIRRSCSQVDIYTTAGTGRNPYRTAPFVAVLGRKAA